jgi:hypothetical protein
MLDRFQKQIQGHPVPPGDTSTEFRETSDLTMKAPITPRPADEPVKTTLKAPGKRPSVNGGMANRISGGVMSLMPKQLLIKNNAKMCKRT